MANSWKTYACNNIIKNNKEYTGMAKTTPNYVIHNKTFLRIFDMAERQRKRKMEWLKQDLNDKGLVGKVTRIRTMITQSKCWSANSILEKKNGIKKKQKGTTWLKLWRCC